MLKIIITDAVISKGFEGKPAFRFNDNKNKVEFKIGNRVYDKNVKDNHRYINFAVKAFSPLSERIEKMKLKEGSRINISGKMDEDQWEDNGQKLSRYVIIADDIEYASSDGGKSNGSGAGSASPVQNGNGTAPQNSSGSQQQSQTDQTEPPPNFTGFETVGGGNDFF